MGEENSNLNWRQVKGVVELDREVTYFRKYLSFLPDNKEIHPSDYSKIYELLDKLKTSPYSRLYSKTIASLEEIKAGLENVLLHAEIIEEELNIPEETPSSKGRDEFIDDIPF